MKRSVVLFSLLVLGVVMGAGTLRVQAQFGNSPEAQAAREKQLALEKATPKLQITEEHLTLTIPGHTVGETEGVAKNSKGTCLCTRARARAVVRVVGRPRNCSSSTKT